MVFTTSAFVSARTLRAGCILSILSMLLMSFAADAQQPAAPASAPAPAVPAKASAPAGSTVPNAATAAKPDIKPLWTELTPLQQQILNPLAPEWNKLDSNHKSKWLAISNKYTTKYATMTPEQQQRLHENIRLLAKMTPEQHRLARESYARAKKLEPEQKTAKWEQYQQLPEDQKQKLAADAAAKKRIVNLPSLQNKAKIVEPLNASTIAKKAPANHNPANQPQVPASATPAASASAPAVIATPAAPAVSK